MLIVLLLFMIIVVAYLVFRKRNLLHPTVYFFGIWIVCVLFTVIDYYGTLIIITPLTKSILTIGIVAFFIGASMPKFKIRKNCLPKVSDSNKCGAARTELCYNKQLICFLLIISLAFNLFMTLITLSLLRNSILYSSIRDIFLSYGDNIGFFASTFFSTFNSWISTPCTYAIATLLAIDLFKKRLNKILLSLMAIDMALFTFATAGRLLLMIFVIQVFFCYFYYKPVIRKKTKKKVKRWILILIISLFVITMYRTKNLADTTGHVNSIYSYFAISIPLLSRWTSDVRDSNIFGGCICTLNGVFQVLYYLISKLTGPIEQYTTVTDLLSLPQDKWVNIYPNYWANAFCTMFYYFYVDLREWGVGIYSFAFGWLCKIIYRRSCINRDERYLPLYLIFIQTIFCSFIRWQWGMFTYVVIIMIMLFPFYPNIGNK